MADELLGSDGHVAGDKDRNTNTSEGKGDKQRVMKPLTRAFCLEGSGDPLGLPVPVTVSLLALRSQVRIQSESVTLSGQSFDASRVSQSKAPLPCACCPPHILCFISNRPFISLFIVVAECSAFFASTHSSIV